MDLSSENEAPQRDDFVSGASVPNLSCTRGGETGPDPARQAGPDSGPGPQVALFAEDNAATS